MSRTEPRGAGRPTAEQNDFRRPARDHSVVTSPPSITKSGACDVPSPFPGEHDHEIGDLRRLGESPGRRKLRLLLRDGRRIASA
jgi:hypothetical protein